MKQPHLVRAVQDYNYLFLTLLSWFSTTTNFDNWLKTLLCGETKTEIKSFWPRHNAELPLRANYWKEIPLVALYETKNQNTKTNTRDASSTETVVLEKEIINTPKR